MTPKNVQMPNPNPEYKPPGTPVGGGGENTMKKYYDCEECEYNAQSDCSRPNDMICPRGFPLKPGKVNKPIPLYNDQGIITNADKIRAMSDPDLAVFLEHAMYDSSEPDWMTVLSWLQQPAEEETP